MRTFVDKLFDGFDEAQAREELDEAIRRAERADAALRKARNDLTKAEQDATEARSAVEPLQRMWDLWESLNEPEGGNGGSSEAPRETVRAAIHRLLAKHPTEKEWTTPEIAAALDRGNHSVQVALSRMARSGELARPSKGLYKLAPRTR